MFLLLPVSDTQEQDLYELFHPGGYYKKKPIHDQEPGKNNPIILITTENDNV